MERQVLIDFIFNFILTKYQKYTKYLCKILLNIESYEIITKKQVKIILFFIIKNKWL